MQYRYIGKVLGRSWSEKRQSSMSVMTIASMKSDRRMDDEDEDEEEGVLSCSRSVGLGSKCST